MRSGLGTLVTLVALVCPGSAAADRADVLVIGYLGPRDSSARLGAEQGLGEANVLGGFVGRRFTLRDVEAPEDGVLALVADAPADVLLATAGSVEATGLAVMNLTAGDDGLREACRPNLFHLAPSARMRRDALAQWRTLHPGDPARARAWHADFKKYAARELNRRFAAERGVPMDDHAWAGWAALRAIAEAAVRGSAEPDALRGYLRDELRLDGQKGAPLGFRPTGQLRQPLLLVRDGAIVGEAPVRGVVDVGDLDSLGLPDCRAKEAAP